MGRTGRFLRRVRSRLTAKPSYFTWVYDGKLAACGLPSSEAQVKWLADHGVKIILTLTESPLPSEWLASAGVSGVHIPLDDHGVPSVEELRDAATFIADQMRKGNVIAVHCLAGKGRTGSVLAAYMIGYEDMNARGAIELIRRKRPGSVERRQADSLYDFEVSFREAPGGRRA